ncbi:hypothetical protein BC939DRAFT_438261, partial [Gamsiella multidivaricata]|uniref:uncharacterized protein n=1 Tax=Gamsiella multidivaricata TaxID=101098 RepID=UPI00221EB7E3
MSNIIAPIVARYSLFFTLALSDSSRVARSKHPRQVVSELVLNAQERFQTHYYANAARKWRALVRNVSTASSSSTNSQSSHSSAAFSAPSSAASSAGFSTPHLTTADGTCEDCFPCCTSSSLPPPIPAFPTSGKNAPDCKSPGSEIDHATALPSPPPSPTLHSSSAHTLPLLKSACACTCFTSQQPNFPFPQSLSRSSRSKADKIARRRQRAKITAVATLLSITLTVIFLSLLQTRRQILRKRKSLSKQQRSQQASPNPSQQQHDRSQYLAIRDTTPKTQTYTRHSTTAVNTTPTRHVKDEYVTTWLKHQDFSHSDIELEVSRDENIDREPSACSDERAVSFRPRTHRRSSSLSNPSTSMPMCGYRSYAEKSEADQHRMYDQHKNPSSQLHHYRIQHFPYVEQRVQAQSVQHHRYQTVPAAVDTAFACGAPLKSAEELAWERHYYYQRLQQEEEQMALQLQQAQLQYGAQVYGARPLHQDASVARTGSLNRLASPAVLSTETSRVLGLCRSNTFSLSAAAKRMSLIKKENPSRAAIPVPAEDTKGAAVAHRSSPARATEVVRTTPHVAVSTTTTQAVMTHKKTLRQHLTPSFRSLARQCSRFGGRPNSFAGTKTTPVPDCPQGRRSLGSRSGANFVASGGHMSDFKPLQAGPETIEILKQNQLKASQTETLPELIQVNRQLALFRSKTTRVPGSSPYGQMGARAETLPSRSSHRNSLRFANGRGLDFSTFIDPNHGLQAQGSDKEERRPLAAASVPSLSGVLGSEAVPDEEEHESMRRQIATILSLTRKDRHRRQQKSSLSRSGSATLSLSSLSSSSSSSSAAGFPQQQQQQQQCLSPLAVEAQEVLPQQWEDEEGEAEREKNMIESELQDPCEHIAFMLVPKSRYEFQPLV